MQAQQVSTYYSFMKMNMLDKFLIEYYDRFSENSSIFTVSNTEENKFVKIIKKCLDNDRSYKTETNKKHFYKKPAGKIWWLIHPTELVNSFSALTGKRCLICLLIIRII